MQGDPVPSSNEAIDDARPRKDGRVGYMSCWKKRRENAMAGFVMLENGGG